MTQLAERTCWSATQTFPKCHLVTVSRAQWTHALPTSVVHHHPLPMRSGVTICPHARLQLRVCHHTHQLHSMKELEHTTPHPGHLQGTLDHWRAKSGRLDQLVLHLPPVVVITVRGTCCVACRLMATASSLPGGTCPLELPLPGVMAATHVTAQCGSKHFQHHLVQKQKRFLQSTANYEHPVRIFKIPLVKTRERAKPKINRDPLTKTSQSTLEKSQRKPRTTLMVNSPAESAGVCSSSSECPEPRPASGGVSVRLLEATTTTTTTLPPPRCTRQREASETASLTPSYWTSRCRRARRWSEWWARVVIVLTVWVWAGDCHPHVAHTPNICQGIYNGTADKICRSMDLRNNIRALDKLCPCRIIDGHLHFVLQEQRDNTSIHRLSQYSFPGLREITHHLLVYRVFNLTSLGRLFPNLAVIRGDVLFHNYALVIYDVPSLEEVGLASLTVILRGSVRIERNPRLCYVHTVDWDRITVNRLAENYLNRNRPESECPSCPEEPGCGRSKPCGAPRCWGPRHCQILCGKECPGGCVGDQCCHQECLGGCLTPDDPTSCHACRNLLDQDRCTQSCSTPKFKVLKHRCEDRESCSINYFVKNDTQECVLECPSGYTRTTVRSGSRHVTECVPCAGFVCAKSCNPAPVKSISHAQVLRGCTIINGSLIIHINGGEDIERELEENLSSIEEIRDYVKIFRSNVTSLNFLGNLTRIGGHRLLHSNYSVVILDNPNLQTLWNSTNLTIDNGKVFVQSNPKLCLHHIEELIDNANITGLSETDVSSTSNGDKVPCNVTPLNASVSQPPLYGTLTVTVAASLLPSVTVYYVNYKKADKNISLYESEGPCSDQGWSTMEMGAGNSTGGTITGNIVNLEPYTRYAVYVKTYSLATSAKGAQSDVLYAFTRPYNPTEPVHLEWASANSSSLEVWWEPPRRPSGVIDHYLVTLTLLLDTPRIPLDLDFCNRQTREYVDKMMMASEEAEIHSVPVRKTLKSHEETQEETPAEGTEEGTCRATPPPTCCACRDPAVDGDQEVMGQIGFEDFIMDTVYVKKSNRSRRRTHESLLFNDEEFEAKLRAAQQPAKNTLLKHMESEVLKDAATISEEPAGDGVFVRSFPGGDNENEEFPLHQGSMVHEFPSHAGIHPHYQPHEENLTRYEKPHPQDSSVLQYQEHLTHEPRLSLHNLHHYSLYSVGVKACQAPVPVPLPGRLLRRVKLCSTIPARVAAHTRSSEVADQVPEGSLRAVVQTNTSRTSVIVTWDPPRSPNGGVVAYILKIHGSLPRERCVTSRKFEEAGRRYELRDLLPGNYTVWVRVRSKAKYGNFSAPVSFAIMALEEGSTREAWVMAVMWVLVMAAAVMMVVALVCWYWRRLPAAHTIPDTLEKIDINPYYREGFAPAEIFREEFIFWRDDLKVRYDRPLGHGFFGMVFEGEVNRGGQRTRVAIKTHNEKATAEEIHQFLREAALMQNISCHHVVRLLGVVGDYSPVYVVMELMQEGDLKTFLRKHPHNYLTGQKMIEMAVEAADGMAYLAAGKLVHRDLAARNCMLDHELTLKIGDFGLTRNLKSDYYRKEGQGVLPVKWMAPESLQFSRYSTQSDVWSYGVLLWEMATRGVTPYKNRTNDEVIRLVVERYATLSRPRNCPKPLQRVMTRCWYYEARERPSFLAIIKYLLKNTSADYQQRFEKVSFYHSRSSDYSRYSRTEASGFMAEFAQETDSDDSDDLALRTSSEQSDTEAPENVFIQYRRTPHGSPRSGLSGTSPGSDRTSPRSGRTSPRSDKTSPRSGRTSLRPGTTSFSERLLDPGDCGRWSGMSQEKVRKHLYTNFSAEDSLFDNRPHAGRLTQEAAGPWGAAGLPTLLMPQDDREVRYAQLLLSTPSTPASGPMTPSSNPVTPSSNPQTPFQHPHRTKSPTCASPALHRSLSPATRTSLGSSPTITTTSQFSVEPLASSPNSSRPFYSNLQRRLSSLDSCSIQRPPPHDEGSSLTVDTQTHSCPSKETSACVFGEDGDRSPPSTTVSAPSSPCIRKQEHTDFPESTVSSPATPFTTLPAHHRHTEATVGDPLLTAVSQTLPVHTPPTSKIIEIENTYVNSNTSTTSTQDASQNRVSFPDSFLNRIQRGYAAMSLPSSRTASLRKGAAVAVSQTKRGSSPGDFEML